MQKPKRLPDGAHIRVVAPASICNQAAVDRTAAWLQQRGYRVSMGSHVYDVDRIFAGRDVDRAQDIVDAVNDPSVDAIFAARGGYGSARVLPYLARNDWRDIKPKIFLGYSDMTALHSFWQMVCGWVTFHGPMMESDWTGINGETALAVLRGDMTALGPVPLEPLLPSVLELPQACWQGGNLAVLTSLIGTPYFPSLQGSVCYLEEVQEAPYRVDRMLQQLYQSGSLEGAVGLVFGEATRCDSQDERGYQVREVVQDFALQHQIPAWWGFWAGHGPTNLTVPLGIELRHEGSSMVFEEAAVQ